MTTIYLITNNYTFKNPINYTKMVLKENEKELLPLSFKGEKIASEIAKKAELLDVQKIYSSNHMSALNSAKYLSEEKNLPIQVDERLRERKVGILGVNNEKFLKETQEHDFAYKLPNGESMKETQERMKSFLKEILANHKEETMAIFTHDIAVESLLSIWCEKGFNLENQLILNFKEQVIMDGAYHPYRIFQLTFENMKIIEINWLNKNE